MDEEEEMKVGGGGPCHPLLYCPSQSLYGLARIDHPLVVREREL